MNISISSAAASSSPGRKRPRPTTDAHSSTIRSLPGLRAVVTHRWLEAFVANTVAVAKQQQRGKGKGGSGRAAPVVEVPALAECVRPSLCGVIRRVFPLREMF